MSDPSEVELRCPSCSRYLATVHCDEIFSDSKKIEARITIEMLCPARDCPSRKNKDGRKKKIFTTVILTPNN